MNYQGKLSKIIPMAKFLFHSFPFLFPLIVFLYSHSVVSFCF
ncbi:hypothetical protein HMPREF9442_02829 [Paraprevotella xylaniphila YIT 11841]|uniref:Uncharacterized protein n=1 Tax=Paraprevotella xylaniphila YIT 11841 TaxID=762982 RepID=F3QX94_9BACT|nr:hypothetical protein HMPREF9442_02829 [Paraprevotella xylaniphila YIT 11841]